MAKKIHCEPVDVEAHEGEGSLSTHQDVRRADLRLPVREAEGSCARVQRAMERYIENCSPSTAPHLPMAAEKPWAKPRTRVGKTSAG